MASSADRDCEGFVKQLKAACRPLGVNIYEIPSLSNDTSWGFFVTKAQLTGAQVQTLDRSMPHARKDLGKLPPAMFMELVLQEPHLYGADEIRAHLASGPLKNSPETIESLLQLARRGR